MRDKESINADLELIKQFLAKVEGSKTMTSKKTSEMTFREFLKASKAAKNLLIDNVETDMLTKMRQEGFTDEEIYNMLMPKLWNLYLEVIGNYLEKAFSELAPLIEANPNLANHPKLQKLQKQLTESLEKLEKEGAK